MVILNPENTKHEITIIPRVNASNISIVLKNESKNITEVFDNIETVYNYGYLTFEIEKTVFENESFEYSVFNYSILTADNTIFSADSTQLTADQTELLNSNLLFRGKAFATSQQDLKNYKIRN